MGIVDWLRPSMAESTFVPFAHRFWHMRGSVWMMAIITSARALGLALVIVFAASQTPVVAAQRWSCLILAVDTAILVNPWREVPRWFLHFNVTLGAVLTSWLLMTAHSAGTEVGNMLALVGYSVYAAIWFPARQARIHVAILLVLTGVAIFAVHPVRVASAIWLPGAGAAVLLAWVIGALTRRIQVLATHDELTQVLNRAGMRAVIPNDAESSAVAHALVVIDLDGFKQVNDTQGHDAGDALLRRFAAALRDSMRPQDVVVRSGGDEFLVLLPNTTPADARSVMERVLPRMPIGASFGVAAWSRQADFDEAHGVADAEMYQAKAMRRSQGQSA